MAEVKHVIVRAQKQSPSGKTKYYDVHNQAVSPPCSDKQILAAVKQQYDVINCVVTNDEAVILVRAKVE